MNKEWADPDYVGKYSVSIMNILSVHFHKDDMKFKDTQYFYKFIKLCQALC